MGCEAALNQPPQFFRDIALAGFGSASQPIGDKSPRHNFFPAIPAISAISARSRSDFLRLSPLSASLFGARSRASLRLPPKNPRLHCTISFLAAV
jgi:hypothetical protein